MPQPLSSRPRAPQRPTSLYIAWVYVMHVTVYGVIPALSNVPFRRPCYNRAMPRHLTPGGLGEKLIHAAAPQEAPRLLTEIQEWAPPESTQGRCNDRCRDLLGLYLGPDDAAKWQAAINDDGERFFKAKSDREEAQALQFGNRAKKITPERVANYNKRNAERQKRYRQRMREAQNEQS